MTMSIALTLIAMAALDAQLRRRELLARAGGPGDNCDCRLHRPAGYVEYGRSVGELKRVP